MTHISRARRLRNRSTDAERLLWSKLRDRRTMGCKFRRQFPVGRYIVDFVCWEHSLIIELDGGHHQDQQDYDEARTGWLRSRGFMVLRYWDNDVLTELDSVLESISEVLRKRGAGFSPSPQPSPPGEGAVGSG